VLIIHKGFFERDKVAKDDKYYLFGDNMIGKGNAGQAVIRGLPNAFGIPTKKLPAMTPQSFFSDDEYYENICAIICAFQKVPRDKPIVIAEAGLGTGLANLKEKAPKTALFLESFIKSLDNNQKYMT
jgi:hypothetical protein